MLLITTALAASPPGPPARGPGAPHYPHGTAAVVQRGCGSTRAWLYLPADPAPATAPVVVYLHGFGHASPDRYDALLTHLARRGYTVVYPALGSRLSVGAYPDNARRAIADALQWLDGPEGPDPGPLALVGHSLGGMLAVRLAARAPSADPPLPVPGAVVLHDPAGARFVDWHGAASELVDPLALLILSVPTTLGSDNDAARPVWDRTGGLTKRVLWVVPSDPHGDPPLVSDHLGVHAVQRTFRPDRPLDAIDWWGYWRPTEAALSEALLQQIPDHGSVFCVDCPAVAQRGEWSDGTAVVPLVLGP